MEWLKSLKLAIEYIEDNIYKNIELDDIAKHVAISSFYFHKGFAILTGYTIAEYIRNRRLYLASLDLVNQDISIINVAYKYLYETPEAFTKAYKRFHGILPKDTYKNIDNIKVFLPLSISINIQGGNKMDYSIEKLDEFKVIGFKKEIKYESAYADIPKYWDEVMGKICGEKVAMDNLIGMYGICLDSEGGKDSFSYMIAGPYNNGEVVEGYTLLTIPSLTWAKFKAVGPLPTSLQTINTKIFKEWLPGNNKYEMDGDFNIEYYPPRMNTKEADYVSEIWLPVKEI